MTRILLGWLCLVVLLPLEGQAQGLSGEIEADVARVVPEGLPRELTTCKLQDALWGRYDVRVHVTMGTDGLPYLFEMARGRFSRVVDPAPVPGPTRFERTGHITAGSQAEAFGRGLPFFIEVEDAVKRGAVAVRVVANPMAPAQASTLLVLIDQPGSDDLVSVPLLVEPGLPMQHLVASHPAINGPVVIRAAVLKETGTSALMLGCVLSNELEFRPPL